MWIGKAGAMYRSDNVEQGRAVLDQALKVLEKRKHVRTIVGFAKLEFMHGSADLGKSMYKKLLANVGKGKKGGDLFEVYFNQLIGFHRGKEGGDKEVRKEFENVCAEGENGGWNDKRMKFLYKKWMKFEENSLEN